MIASDSSDGEFLFAVSIAAVLVVLAAWLWTAQEDVTRLRREAYPSAATAAKGVK